MGLNDRERRELIKEMNHTYKDKKGRFEKGVTLGDISRDMGHSDTREIMDVNRQIVNEET